MKTIVLLILLTAFTLVAFNVGYNLAAYDFNYNLNIWEKSGSGDYQSETAKCFEVYDVENASVCLRDWIKEFYNYTVREDTTKLIEDIKLNGGDCYDYTQLYKSHLNYYGYYTKQIDIISEDRNNAHTFLIAYDKNLTKYCRLDQLYITCLELGGSGNYIENNTKK